MNYDEYELTLFDRIEVIKQANKKYDLENNAYISFSGGKDSTVLHYLMDMALPNNRMQRVSIRAGFAKTTDNYANLSSSRKEAMRDDMEASL